MAPGDPVIGVMIPTFRRPDLLRACVLQWLVQSRRPDRICVHQNGSAESHEWCVDDLLSLGRIVWLHSPQRLPQHQWYAVPLRRLLAEGCSHFFWADHDDIYRRDHVAQCLAELAVVVFTISDSCGVLYVAHDDYRYVPLSKFTVHAPGGMSASMAFNRPFAKTLADDLDADRQHHYSDNVLACVTLPRHSRQVSQRRTTVNVSHRGSVRSAGWLDRVFTAPEPPDRAGDPSDASG